MDASVAHNHPAPSAHVDDDAKVRLGMRFYVITDIVFVAFLFVTYIWLRSNNTLNSWFPAGTKLPDLTTSNVLTGLIVVSAIAYFIGYMGIRAGNQMVLRVGALVALGLTLVTLVLQIRYMTTFPFVAGDGSFASTYIFLNGYHVYHLLIGVFLGLGLTIRAFTGRYSQQRTLGVVTIGYFWYWMAAFPVIFAIILAVLPPNIS